MNQRDEDRELAASLFGTVGKAKATGGHVPDRAELTQPLEHPKSVIHSFCTGCGMYLEHFMKSVDRLAAEAELEIPGNLDGYYIETASCDLCDGTDKTIAFKKISDI